MPIAVTNLDCNIPIAVTNNVAESGYLCLTPLSALYGSFWNATCIHDKTLYRLSLAYAFLLYIHSAFSLICGNILGYL